MAAGIGVNVDYLELVYTSITLNWATVQYTFAHHTPPENQHQLPVKIEVGWKKIFLSTRFHFQVPSIHGFRGVPVLTGKSTFSRNGFVDWEDFYFGDQISPQLDRKSVV